MTKERKMCGVKVFVSGETYNEYKGTLEEQLEEKDKEIERLNNIIDELEKYLKENSKDLQFECSRYYKDVLDKLKELKESGVNE